VVRVWASEQLVVERSNTVYEELMLFFFRGDLEQRLQRCLNMEQVRVIPPSLRTSLTPTSLSLSLSVVSHSALSELSRPLALTPSQADTAQMLREKIGEIEAAIAAHSAKKRGLAQAMVRAGSPQGDATAMDRAALGLSLKSDMQRAIEEERYQDAASLRDRLAGTLLLSA
jgi:hypothetical protein